MTFDYLCDWLKGSAAGADCQPAESRQKRKLKKSCPVCNHEFQGWNYKAKHPPRRCPASFRFVSVRPSYFTQQSWHKTPPRHAKRGRESNAGEMNGGRCSVPGGVTHPSFMTGTKMMVRYICLAALSHHPSDAGTTGREEEEAARRTASQRELLSPRLLLHSSSSLVISP